MIMEKILSQKVTIINELGIHARPAAMIAKIASNAQKLVWIEYDHAMIDASNIIDILSIGCKKGEQVLIKIEAKKDIHILESIQKLIQQGFGENINA